MDDITLDERLARAAAPLPDDLTHLAHVLATKTMPSHTPRRASRRWTLAGIALGAAVLTGATTWTAATLAGWQGVSMPEDAVRNATPIPLIWTTPDGTTEACGAWIEVSHPDPADLDLLNGAITERDWRGFGQDLYDGSAERADDPDGEQRVSDAFQRWVPGFVTEVLGDIRVLGADAGRHVSAVGFHCTPDVLGTPGTGDEPAVRDE